MIRRPLSHLVGIAAIVVLAAACSSTGGASSGSAEPSGGAATAGPVDSPGVGAGGACPASQPDAMEAGTTRDVTITTDLGEIVINVEADLSPIAAGNFVALAECGWYDGVIFHRVIPEFVIQGGDGEFGRAPDIDTSQIGTGGPGYAIQDEPVTAPYGRGVVAMARSSAPNSVGSQFFIVVDDEAVEALESANTYQIIGSVTSGMETADAIVSAPRDSRDFPNDPVIMTDVSVAP